MGSWYLGPIGNMQALPDPDAFAPVRDRIGGTHQLLSGARVRDTLAYKRTWKVSWDLLTDAEFGLLEGLVLGAYGARPYALQDLTTNMLQLPVSTAGQTLKSTAGLFGYGSVGGISYTTSYGSQVTGVAGGVTYNNGGTNLTAGFQGGIRYGYPSAYLTPVAPGMQIVGSVSAYLGGSSTGGSASLRSFFDFLDASGSYLTGGGGNTQTLPAAWTRLTTTATVPANAAYAVYVWTNAAAYTGTLQVLTVDPMITGDAEGPSAWVPGTGNVRVAIDSLDHSVPVLGWHTASMTLVEL